MLVGSAGCDGQDKECTMSEEDKEQMAKLHAFRIDGDGKMTSVEGMPITLIGKSAAWITIKHPRSTGQARCIFTIDPMTNIIEQIDFDDKTQTIKNMSRKFPIASDFGPNPVHASVVEDGKTMVVANYHGPDDQKSSKGASVESMSMHGQSCALFTTDFKLHAGKSIDPQRQLSAHPHSAVAGRNSFKDFVFACDLGMDVIFTYIVTKDGMLTEKKRTKVEAGSGPRHAVLHPTKSILFVVTEMGHTISSYKIEADGGLKRIAKLDSQPKDSPKGYGSKAAEVAISQNGLHLYVSNRAFDPKFKNTIAVYDVSDSGKMKLVQQQKCDPFPRGMQLMPDGKFLLVASQRTGLVSSFKVDNSTGKLSSTNYTWPGPKGAAAFAVPFDDSSPALAVTELTV